MSKGLYYLYKHIIIVNYSYNLHTDAPQKLQLMANYMIITC